jgi:hypothetical protein
VGGRAPTTPRTERDLAATVRPSLPSSVRRNSHSAGGTPPVRPGGVLRVSAVVCPAVVRVMLVNGRTLWLKDVADDEEWLRGTNSRGRGVLLSRARVKALRPN